jgi:hypothetical protein
MFNQVVFHVVIRNSIVTFCFNSISGGSHEENDSQVDGRNTKGGLTALCIFCKAKSKFLNIGHGYIRNKTLT